MTLSLGLRTWRRRTMPRHRTQQSIRGARRCEQFTRMDEDVEEKEKASFSSPLFDTTTAATEERLRRQLVEGRIRQATTRYRRKGRRRHGGGAPANMRAGVVLAAEGCAVTMDDATNWYLYGHGAGGRR